MPTATKHPLYYLIDKPYNLLSQFTRELPTHRTLADLPFDFPKDVYPVGRLDRDSEGLLILTNDAQFNQRLLKPTRGHRRAYLVQVEGVPTPAALEQLRSGVELRINKKDFRTRPAGVTLLEMPPILPERDPPVRYRAAIPTAWLELTLTEGKNRQVRKMGAAVGFPVLRLVRQSIQGLSREDLGGEAVREIGREELWEKLGWG